MRTVAGALVWVLGVLGLLVVAVTFIAIGVTLTWYGFTGGLSGWLQFSLVVGGLTLTFNTTLSILKGIYNAGKEAR